MRNLVMWAMTAAAIVGSLGLVPAAAAQNQDVDLSVEVRWRPESTRMQFTDGSAIKALGAEYESSQSLRTRVSALFAPNTSTTQARVDLQDARTLGAPGSGSVAGDANLGIYQAYLRITKLFHPQLQLQAGRFELDYGNGRVLSSDSWSNTGRAFDGAKVSVVGEKFNVDVIYAKLVERAALSSSHDTDLWAAYASFTDASTDVFFLFDTDQRTIDSERLLQRFTAGTHSARQVTANVDYIANAAYQFGTAMMPSTSAPSGLAKTDIAAYLAAIEVGFTPNVTPARFAIGVDYASGDDPASESFNAYDQAYANTHSFRGEMDQFAASNPEGLLDLYMKAVFEPAPKWEITGAGHWFQTAQEFESALDPAVMATGLGAEADLMLSTKVVENAVLSLGGALFFPTEDWRGPQPDVESWGFTSVTVHID